MAATFPPTEAGDLIRSHDWARTPLGPMEGWPAPLKTIVGVMLHSRHPMFLWWGPELIQLYNDAYVPSFGVGKHPAAMGQRGADCWQEIWPIIFPQIDEVMRHARPSWNEDHLVPIFRNGLLEEVFWTYGYSPVFGDDGRVGGTLVVCTETTARVLAERRGRLLHQLAEAITRADDDAAIMAQTDAVLADHRGDVPFVGWYTGAARRRTGGFGLDGAAAEAVDRAVRAHRRDGPAELPIDPVRLPAGPWPEPVTGVFVVPIARDARGEHDYLVAGLSPRLPFDDRYRALLLQIADAVSRGHQRIDAWQLRLTIERERNNLLMKAPVATALMTGPDHVYRLANPRYCEIVDRTDLVGLRYLEAFPELAGTDLPAILDRVYRTGEPFVAEEHLARLARRGPGELQDRYFKFNLEPVRDAHDVVYGMMVMAVDITEQVEARRLLERNHREREQLLRELETANRSKDEFLAMLGHELRNPLSPIVIALELLRLRSHGELPNEIAMIERQVGHLTRMVDDLLDVSRIAHGQIELRRERIELATLVERAIETASPLLERAGHALTVEVPLEGLPLDVDPTRIAQVIANLLTNAAKYTPPRGHVTITGTRDGDQVVLRVHDDGVGIADDMLPLVFGLFTQVRQDIARSAGGLGLGLAIVKNLVELHGGTVTAASPGRGLGTTMTVRLPIVQGAARIAGPPAGADRAAADRGAPLRILVVDDNQDVAEAIADVLLDQGYHVTIANDGPGALRAVRESPPAIALLDIGLPVMDGYQLARQLRADPTLAGIKLIAVTGYGRADDRLRSDAAGFDVHLVKPVSMEILAETIRSLIAAA